eukprot:TRINITY_DN15325_c0_g1_i4.p1 TRINITY_DN15325_c0_g1~~TRINITY_DN15325_c0_g1_i4.p1  ORF type:complete len:708 (-),score=86.97 TRINITY_DN15325_c0_g1_i4:133-2256(-)
MCPDPAQPLVLAAGSGNGKLALVNFASDGKIMKEFVPKCSRACNAVAWSPAQPALVAVGLNKLRQDCSTLVWDINSCSGAEAEAVSNTSLARRHESSSTPLYNLGNCEGAASLCWSPDSYGQTLLVGTTYKWMRVYDLRTGGTSPTKAAIAHSKQVCGMCLDPLDGRRVATFSEDGFVKVWDMRMINSTKTTPVSIVNAGPSKIRQISWCPTRAGVLTTHCEGSPNIVMWNLSSNNPTQVHDSDEAATVQPWQEHAEPCGEPYVSFDWHPSIENRMLMLTGTDQLQDTLLRRPMALSWAADGSLAYSCERSLNCLGPPAGDIVVEMLRLARMGYGVDTKRNLDMMAGNTTMEELWRWIARIQMRVQSGDANAWNGVMEVLAGQEAESADENTKVLTSSQRSRAMSLCSAHFESAEATRLWVDELLQESQIERAAMVSLFHLDLDTALRCLQHQEQKDYAVVAMALSGYPQASRSSEPSKLWFDTCSHLAARLEHPCLRAMFAFLTSNEPQYREVLKETQLPLEDRITFACCFLPYEQLLEYISDLSGSLIQAGDLGGLQVTGVAPDGPGIELLRHYVDRTCDIQTAAMVSAMAAQSDQHYKKWITLYRDFMDQWQLWHQRAKLDIALAALGPSKQVQPQIYAKCYFCSSSLTQAMNGPTSMPSMGKMAEISMRLMCCPNCGKPLPKCAVCCLPLTCLLYTSPSPRDS